jgi:tetratricopeptide (TPR) repeat protein
MLLTLVAGALAGGLLASPSTSQDVGGGSAPGAAGDTCRPRAAARLVRGVRMFERQEMREGLEVLAGVLRERPDWAPALSAYAGALLRSGRFAEAADAYAELIGRDTARDLARGQLTSRDLGPAIDPDHILGLAIARHEQGDFRAADRLYRTYADLVGPTSARAARAYWRLSEMFSESGVPWGDAAAERAKALAVDPSIGTRVTLPDLPDVRSIAETEPYAREIALATDRAAPEGGLQSLPILIDWSPPAFEDVGADTEWTKGIIEVLVGKNGRPEDLALPAELDIGSGAGAALARAALAWCFEPALGESGAVAAWITLDVDTPAAEPAEDTTAAPGETAPELPDTTRRPDGGASGPPGKPADGKGSGPSR